MQLKPHSEDLTKARPRERNSKGVRGKYIPVVPTLASIERRQAAARNQISRSIRNAQSGPSSPSSSSGAFAAQGIPTGRQDAADEGNKQGVNDEITEEDRYDLAEFAALSSWSKVKLFPICQIDPPSMILGTALIKGLFAEKDVQTNVCSGDRDVPHKREQQAPGNTSDPELAEFAALSHLPAIFGAIDPIQNHPSADNG